MNDYELVYLAQEENEIAHDILNQKYGNLINILINKRKLKMKTFEYNELYNRCLTSFNSSIYKYNPDSKATFATFATVVINNEITSYINYVNSKKSKNLNDTLSLDYEYADTSLLELIPSNDLDPLKKIASKEEFADLKQKIKEVLSPFEYKVYTLLLQEQNYQQIARKLMKNPKQIDNAIQRIKNKIKSIIIA